MKKILLFIMLIIPFVVRAESNYLYDILKNEAESNGLAKEYTEDHHDSFTKEPSDKIYHWYAADDNEGTQIGNKDNVIFGDFCWRIVRTTDTGGVKLLYNGEAEDNKCIIDTSKKTVLYGVINVAYLNNTNYYYSTDYTVDEATSSFRLSGEKKQLNYDEYQLEENKKYKYTCYNSNPDATCVRLKQIMRLDNAIYYFDIKYENRIDSIGNVQYNDYTNSVGEAGYMYNSKYPKLQKGIVKTEDVGFYYGNDVVYENGTYRLVDSKKILLSSPLSNLNGYHYSCFSEETTCSEVNFIYYAKNESYNNRVSFYYVTMSDGNTIEDVLNDNYYEAINEKDSTTKTAIDDWFSKRLIDYSPYLEDTIFCNNRKIESLAGFDKDGAFSIFPEFYEKTETELLCYSNNDKFSLNNPKAKLTYPVGLITKAELSLYNNNKARTSRNYYTTMTPSGVENIIVGSSSGSISGNTNISYVNYVRPVISLKKGIRYLEGNGSKENPYILDYTFNINNENDNQFGNIDIVVDDIKHVNKDEKVILNITPKKGYELFNIEITDVDGNIINYKKEDNYYYFIMPSNNITIEPIYTKKVITYKFIEGMNQFFDVAKDTKLKFKLDLDYEEFMNSGKVYVDKEFVENKHYEAKEDNGTIIIFNDEYSKSLKEGKHEIVTILEDGSKAVTEFTISEITAEKYVMNPNTNDIIIVLLIISLILSFIIFKYTTYKKNKVIR